MNALSERKIENFRVIESSGCHRYTYWNEQFLNNSSLDNGWCTPSRSIQQQEMLVVSLERECTISKIRMLSRKINESQGFPVAFRWLGSNDLQNWESLIDVEGFVNTKETWHEWPISSTQPVQYLKLEIDQVNWRKEGKYFVQFMALEFYENSKATQGTSIFPFIANMADIAKIRSEQATKYGISGTSHSQTTVWALDPGQGVSAHCHLDGKEIHIVWEGKGHFYCDLDMKGMPVSYEPKAREVVIPPKDNSQLDYASRQVEKGDIISVNEGMVHYFRASEDDSLVILSIITPGYNRSLFASR